MTLIFDYFSYPKTISPYPGCLDHCICGSMLHILPISPSFSRNKNSSTFIFDYFSCPKTISPYPGCPGNHTLGSKLHTLQPSFLSLRTKIEPIHCLLFLPEWSDDTTPRVSGQLHPWFKSCTHYYSPLLFLYKNIEQTHQFSFLIIYCYSKTVIQVISSIVDSKLCTVIFSSSSSKTKNIQIHYFSHDLLAICYTLLYNIKKSKVPNIKLLFFSSSSKCFPFLSPV